MLLTEHGLQTSNDSTELVRLGPEALPYLLESLEDKTATKLVIQHEQHFGAMWFANELCGNPANALEQRVIGTNEPPPFGSGSTISSYTVKVGDICFVIIGEIVGREYEAVRYQPTSCVIINSPTHDPKLAGQVRAIWSNRDSRQHLLDSLLLDYSSEGGFNGKSLDGWDVGSSLQCSAATRLLFYFPEFTTKLVADRLSKLDVHLCDDQKTPDESMMREVKNGVRTENFLKAVAWCEEPVIRLQLKNIFQRTLDPELLPILSDKITGAEVRQHLEEAISRLPEIELGPFGDGYNLLVAFGEKCGTQARPAFERYMTNASLQRCRSMSQVLRKTQGEWSIDLLKRLLNDKRPADGWTYAVIPHQNEPRLPIRICDEAAETISMNFPKLTFKMEGSHEQLDQQIEKMRRQIESK
ncbi:MAG: hypothetical protein JWM68_1083 [Verrucomicrobiales bacterium]|nr:hypothetical protein [Verrucomicrobiales bacterium]